MVAFGWFFLLWRTMAFVKHLFDIEISEKNER